MHHHVAFQILRPKKQNKIVEIHFYHEKRSRMEGKYLENKTHLSVHFHLPQLKVSSHRIVAYIVERRIHHRRHGIFLQVSIKKTIRGCVGIVHHLLIAVVEVIHFRYPRVEIHSNVS